MIEIPSHLDAVIEAGGSVVTPTRQRAHGVRLAHAAGQLARGLRVWRSPDVLPLEGWLTRALEQQASGADPAGMGPRLLRPVEEWLLWRECAEQAAADLALVNRGALAEGLLGASRLAGELGLDLTAVQAPADTETALLVAVHRAVAERARALGASTLDEALRRVDTPGEARPLALGGFLKPTPRLRAIQAQRAARGWETLWEAPPSAMARTEVVCAADEMEELDRIAGWCAESVRRRADVRLLVVLPGSVARCERLAALIRQGIDARAAYAGGEAGLVALQGGAPLAHQPAVAHALAALSLLGGESVPVQTLLEWLRSPFWRESPETRARLDLWLRERAPPVLERQRFERLLEAAPAGLGSAIGARIGQAGAALQPASASPREWSERFHAALEALGWPGAPGLDSATQQTLVRLRELFEEYGQLSVSLSRITRSAALERLSELAARTAYRPADEDAVVTVSAVLADPVVRYDGIWVAGLHADALPQAPAPDPFVPLAAQLKADWAAASPAGRVREAHALLGAWQRATDELVLSSPLRAEDVALLPSAVLAPWMNTTASGRAPLAWLAERMHRPEQLECWSERSTPWDVARALPAGTRSLELQNTCPFRAYAELRLGCEPLVLSEPGVAADLRGRLLHAALQALWSELGESRALAALSPDALDARLEACIEQATTTVLSGQSVLPSAPAIERERRRAHRLIRALCAIERERAAFTVRSTEEPITLQLAGVSLQMRMDRVDVTEDGAVVILDYKSGRPLRADWYGQRPSHPQLLAYQSALGDAVRALATVHLSARELGFHGIAARAGLLPNAQTVKADPHSADPWAARLAAWRAVLEALASGFAHGTATVDPRPGACAYCHLQALCRIGESLEALGTDDDQDIP